MFNKGTAIVEEESFRRRNCLFLIIASARSVPMHPRQAVAVEDILLPFVRPRNIARCIISDVFCEVREAFVGEAQTVVVAGEAVGKEPLCIADAGTANSIWCAEVGEAYDIWGVACEGDTGQPMECN